MDDGLVVTKVPGRLAHYLCMKFGTTVVPLARFQSEDTVKVFMDYLRKGSGKPFTVIDEDLLEEDAVFADPTPAGKSMLQILAEAKPENAESHENGNVKFCVLCRSGGHKPVPLKNYMNRGG